jgi:hypothetical protein
MNDDALDKWRVTVLYCTHRTWRRLGTIYCASCFPEPCGRVRLSALTKAISGGHMSPTVLAATVPVADVVASGLPLTPGFDQRWAAWQERGRLHDREVRRRLWIAVPVIVVLAAIGYMMLSR